MSDPSKSRQQGTVCVVSEWPKTSPMHKSIYGVFTTESLARADYGDEDERHGVSFNVVPLWATR